MLPLPQHQDRHDEEDEQAEDEEDPRAELVRRLLEYQKYKEVSQVLESRPQLGRDLFTRASPEPEVLEETESEFVAVGLFDLLEALRVTLELAGMAENGSRFRLANDFYKADGTLCGRLRSEIGWLDLQARRLIVPPDDVQAALARLTRTADFAVLPPSVK